MPRTLYAAAVALLALAPAVPSDAAPCPTVTRQGYWTTVTTPVPTVTSYAVDPLTPKRLLVTDGTTLHRSVDGGCTWTAAFTLPASPAPATPYSTQTHQVTQVQVPGTPAGRAYFVLEPRLGDTTPTLFASNDGGATWAAKQGGGLPPVALLFGVTAAPSNGDVLYGLLRAYADWVYRSTDGGATWEQRSGPHYQLYFNPVLTNHGNIDAALSRVTVDPLSPDLLWLYGAASPMYASADGGKTLTKVAGADSVGTGTGNGLAGRSVAVHHAKGRPVALTAVSRQAIRMSRDGAKTFRTVPAAADTVAYGATPDALVLSTGDLGKYAVLRYDRRKSAFVDVTPKGASAFDVTADRTKKPAFYLRGAGKLYVYTGPVG